MADDFLEQLIRLVQEAAQAGADPKIRVQQHFGGERYYIPKAPAAGKTQRLAADLAAGRPLTEAFAAAGVHSTWGYRLLRRRVRR
jgi:hypothetical protein